MTSEVVRTDAKLRVYFVNRYFHPDQSATSQLLSDLAFGLAEHGIEVHIICARQLYDTPAARLPAQETLRGVIVHRLWTTRFGRRRLPGRALDYASFYFTCAIALLRRLCRSDIVVAKTDPPLVSIVAWLAVRLRHAVLINWLQDVFPEVATALGANPLPGGLDRLLRRLRDGSLRSAACNVVLGNRMREYLNSRIGPTANFRIIENWADAALQPKQSSESVLRERLKLAGKFVVGYSGNLGRAHEYDTLLGAAEALPADDTIAFLFTGGGVKMDALKALAAHRALPSFQFLPYQPRGDLADSLAAADVHLVSLIPALEGFIVPSKFYGILAVARPVVFVGDPQGELANIIRESGCGVVVAAGDSAGLAQVILRLKEEPVARAAMGAAARELLCSRYSTCGAIASWMALLGEIQATTTVGKN
jgi:colanic acid biosynthesis glycosyl transferase WcaI